MRFLLTIVLIMIGNVSGYPSVVCPSYLSESGFVNDLGLLAETVSWDATLMVNGTCGTYRQIFEKHGKYDTRLRIYEDVDTEDIIFSFRPTQQTTEGGDIHNDRKLSACRFMNGSCFGLVNERFQDAFITLIEDLNAEFFNSLPKKKVSTVGHSLGGSFQLMMGVYLNSMYGIVPKYMIGLAGPFVGDIVFTDTYQRPLKDELQERWWQIETVDVKQPDKYDGTVEDYNVNVNTPALQWDPFRWNPVGDADADKKTPIYIEEDAICRFEIIELANSYGMHDLKNYRSVMQGKNCSLHT